MDGNELAELQSKVLALRSTRTKGQASVAVLETANKYGVDPIDMMFDILLNGTKVFHDDGRLVDDEDPDKRRYDRLQLDSKDHVMLLKELAQYVAPKLKSIDMQTKMDLNVNVSVTRFGDMSPEELLSAQDAMKPRGYLPQASEVSAGKE